MKKRNLLIILIVLSVLSLSAVIGVSVALWSDSDGGESGIAPSAEATNWNSWAKYCIYDEITSNNVVTGYSLVAFEGTVQEDVVIPITVAQGRLEDGTALVQGSVSVVSNRLFSATTDKLVPKTLRIPANGVSIESMAFSGLGNLAKVYVLSPNDESIHTLSVVFSQYAFIGCNNVTEFTVASGATVTFGGNTLSQGNIDAFKLYVGLSITTQIVLG